MSSQKIPKIIHYCWFGGSPIPKKTQRYIATWREKCPDYEIVRWDETNFDVNSYVYTKEAYENKKWAFISDVCRLEAVYKQGGVYIDVNTELVKSLDVFLNNEGFVGFEQQNMIQMGVFGFKKKHPIVGKLLDSYRKEHLTFDDGRINDQTINNRTQDVLIAAGMHADNTYQELSDVVIYPKEYFAPRYWNSSKQDDLTKNTAAVHYYGASWHDESGKKELSQKIKRHDQALRITIVVPVYNVEKYLDDCLESICNQSYEDIEIILVDDGATDNSGSMCDIWAKKDKRIKVVHKKNGGLNAARRDGFLASSGELVTFVDSDDVIAPNYLETLRYALDETGADVSMCGYTEFIDLERLIYASPADGGKGEIVYEPGKENTLRWLIIGGAPWNNSMHVMTAWGKLYRREIIEAVDWELSDFRANEDEAWTMQNLYNAKKGVAVVPQRGYGYRKNQTSITRSTYKNTYGGKTLNKFDFIEKLYRIALAYLGDAYNGPLLMRYARETEHYLDGYVETGFLGADDIKSIDKYLPEKIETMGILDIHPVTFRKMRLIARYGAKTYARIYRNRLLSRLLLSVKA